MRFARLTVRTTIRLLCLSPVGCVDRPERFGTSPCTTMQVHFDLPPDMGSPRATHIRLRISGPGLHSGVITHAKLPDSSSSAPPGNRFNYTFPKLLPGSRCVVTALVVAGWQAAWHCYKLLLRRRWWRWQWRQTLFENDDAKCCSAQHTQIINSCFCLLTLAALFVFDCLSGTSSTFALALARTIQHQGRHWRWLNPPLLDEYTTERHTPPCVRLGEED